MWSSQRGQRIQVGRNGKPKFQLNIYTCTGKIFHFIQHLFGLHTTGRCGVGGLGGLYSFTLHLFLITSTHSSNLDETTSLTTNKQSKYPQKKIDKYRRTTWIATTIKNNNPVWKHCYSLGLSVYSFWQNTDVELWLLMLRLGLSGSLWGLGGGVGRTCEDSS